MEVLFSIEYILIIKRIPITPSQKEEELQKGKVLL
jgi:hypothetical protein